MLLRKFTLTIIFFTLFHATHAQTNKDYRPKIGLCLSGGAAKGIAHISLLKAIDSLGIHIDYITGTSMGAIIGGLYAIGYSGKELEELVKKEDWDLILSNQAYLKDIHIDEKSEYGRYLVEMPVVNNKIVLPSGINEGQNLMVLLRQLTFRVAHIHDFNQFPIPFKCMAADIVSGEGVVLDKGDLAMAIRTSMSIPTIFSPIDRGGEGLMVDGGLIHNFPVDLVCGMGADIVIGSYTGGRLYSKKQLNSFVKLLYQSSSFQRESETREQERFCNILFSSDEALRVANLKISDFNKSKRILAVGDSVMHNVLPQLIALADAQSQYDMSHEIPVKKPLLSTGMHFLIKKIDLNGIDDYKKEVVSNYLQLSEDSIYTRLELQEAINNLYSSNMYKRIFYEISDDTNNVELKINLEEKPPHNLKFGLHYDSQLGSGIMVNWTARNWFGHNSRFIAAVDIAESPKIRMHYRKSLKKSKWDFNLSNIFERTQETLIFEDQTFENYRRRQDVLSAYWSRAINKSTEFGTGFSWNTLDYKPLYNIDDKIYIRDKRPDSLSQLTFLESSSWGINTYFKKNTLNNISFPEKGYSLSIDAKYGFKSEASNTIKTVFSKTALRTEQEKKDTSLAPFIRLSLSFEKAVPVSRKASFIGKINAGILRGGSYVESGRLKSENFLLGGLESRRSFNYFPFAGNREGTTQHSSFATAQLSLQVEAFNNFFIAPMSGFLIGDRSTATWTSGITIGYRSPFIPIMINLSKADNESRIVPYISIGYRF
jgi:NTE family protein